MFNKLLSWLRRPSLQSTLEAYVASKRPTNTAEVEYWVNQYFYGKNFLNQKKYYNNVVVIYLS